MDSRPNFRGASALLRGSSRTWRSEARHTPRRPLSLPYGRGVSDPSPQAPPRQARRISSFSQFKVLLNFFQKIAGSRGSEATEVWVPDQTSGTQAPFFGGLLGPTVRSAASAATPPQFALRARGRRPLPAGPTPTSSANLLFSQFKVLLNFFQKIAGSRGGAPAAARTRRNALSCEALFSGELPRSGERGLFASINSVYYSY